MPPAAVAVMGGRVWLDPGADTPHLGADTFPQEQVPPGVDTPLGADTPGSRYPPHPGADTPHPEADTFPRQGAGTPQEQTPTW